MGDPPKNGWFLYIYIYYIYIYHGNSVYNGFGKGGIPQKHPVVVGYDQWEHHGKWAAQMDWNLHI
jgi:hypothetical protein